MEPMAAIERVSSILATARSVFGALAGLRRTGGPPSSAGAGPGCGANPAGFLDRLAAEFIRQRDADGNGALNPSEFGASKTTFAKLDANGDGEISRAELTRAWSGPGNRVVVVRLQD